MAPYKLWATKGLQKIYNISALVGSTITKLIAPDNSQNELSIDHLTVKIGCTDVPLDSLLFVLSLYGETLGGRGLIRNGFCYDRDTSTVG